MGIVLALLIPWLLGPRNFVHSCAWPVAANKAARSIAKTLKARLHSAVGILSFIIQHLLDKVTCNRETLRKDYIFC